MIFRKTIQGHRFAIPSMLLARRDLLLQLLIVSTLGVVLGGYVLVISSLPAQWTVLLALVVLCPFALMVVGNVQRVLLAVIILDIPLQVDINLNYQYDVAELGTLGGLNISVTTLALAALYVLWLTQLLAHIGSPPRPSLRQSIPLLAYVVIVTLSILVASAANLAFFEIMLFWQTFMLFFYIVHMVRSQEDIRFIVLLLLIGLVLEGLLMIGQRLTWQSISIGGGVLSLDMFGSRVGGTLGHPNSAGSYLSMLIAPAICMLMMPLLRVYKWLAALGIAAGCIALVFTLSRGSWLALVVSVLIVCGFAWHRGWLSLTVPGVAAAIVLLLSLIFRDTIIVRLLGDDGGSAGDRVPLMKLAFHMITDHPILGVGANNFGTMIKEYATPEFGSAWLYTVHNHYLLIWAEVGTCGLLAYLWFLLTTLYRGWQSWIQGDRFLALLALGLMAAIVGHMAHMMFDLFVERPAVQMLWLFAGLIIAIYNMVAHNLANRPLDVTGNV